jgi:uncharacterized coiled-coil DUF342 family protein
MSQASTAQKIQQTETEVAVLRVQYDHLNEKVDDIKTGLGELETHFDNGLAETNKLIKEFQEENKKQHDDVNKKISSLEKWRWMLMGASVLAGALGFEVIGKLLGM